MCIFAILSCSFHLKKNRDFVGGVAGKSVDHNLLKKQKENFGRFHHEMVMKCFRRLRNVIGNSLRILYLK